SCHIRTQTSMSYLFLSITPPPPSSLLFPYTTLFRSKLAYFTLTHRIPRADLPSLTFRGDDGETVRYFPDKLPIGLDAVSRTHIFLFLLTQDLPVDFRAFLERHAELLRALPAWKVRLLVPL